jgi:hypothetical protein
MTYRYNVGLKCHTTDKRVSPPASSSSVLAPFGWAAPGTNDFRLKAGSPAIGAADPNDHPATDRDGFARDGRPDAGAYEFGAGPPGRGDTPGGRPTAPGKRRLVKSARLRPHVICKHRRRGCAHSALLRLSVTERSRLAVRVVRRHGKRVRTMKVGLRKRPALRIRARVLKRGRYRVVVVASGATGLKASARVLRLRVR